MTLTACLTVGVLAGLAWLDRAPPRRPPLTPYVAAALGTLVKGPLAAVLVAGPLVLAGVARHPRPAWRELGLARGLLVAVALVALFWVPVGLLDASYLRAFAATNLRRLGANSPHTAPVYYYLLWLPLLALPWTLLAAPALRRSARDPARRPLLLWAVFVPALLTLARGKLATYALSALVPLALITGPELAEAVRSGPAVEDAPLLRAGAWLGVTLLAVGALAALLLGHDYPVSAIGRAVIAGTAFTWGVLVAAALRGRLALVPAAVLGAVLTLYPLVTRFVAPAVSALHSDYEAARLIAVAQPAAVIAVAARAPSLVFYLGAPVIETEDAKLVKDLFEGPTAVVLVTGRQHFAEVERLLGARAHRWYGTARRGLYGNLPPPAPAAREANGST